MKMKETKQDMLKSIKGISVLERSIGVSFFRRGEENIENKAVQTKDSEQLKQICTAPTTL
jgi:hypothetical protein